MTLDEDLLNIQNLPFYPGLTWSRAVGKVSNLSLPPPVLNRAISLYSRLLAIDTSDVAEPLGGYTTFGEFFARALRPGARPIDSTPGAIVSPCDGVVQDFGVTEDLETTHFEVKGRTYSTSELFGKDWRAERAGYAVIYLSPADYHRVHCPVDGEISGIWHIPGTCFPVNRVGQALAPQAVVTNERVVFDINTEIGRVTVVMVGALAVRAIHVSIGQDEYEADGEVRSTIPVDRGDEMGVFHLGSTVVVLWEGGTEVNIRTAQRILMGQLLALR